MKIYNYDKKYIIGISLVFIIGAIIGILMLASGQMVGLPLLIISLILIYIFTKAKPLFITTDNYIKKSVLNKEDVCNWEWIYEISTDKSSTTGIYTTIIRWSKLDPQQLKDYLSKSNVCNENVGIMLVTSHVADYKQLLNEIVNRSVNVSLDETTTKLLQ